MIMTMRLMRAMIASFDHEVLEEDAALNIVSIYSLFMTIK
jgi:hypothetical protein